MSRGRFVAAVAAASVLLLAPRFAASASARDAKATSRDTISAAQAARFPSAVGALRIAACAERIVALHAQLAQRILVRQGKRALGAALADLLRASGDLRVPAPPSELHERTAILSLLVAQFRGVALKEPARDVAAALAERADEIDWEARRIAELAAPPVGSPAALAAAAVDGAVQAERIARLLLWRRWTARDTAAPARLQAAKARLQSDLDALGGAVGDDAGLRDELQVAENQAAFLFAASWSDEGDRGSLEYAVKAAANARESLERLAARYERAAR